MRTAIIVQARMTSTRLPGKVLLPVLGRPLLSYQVERLRRVRLAGEIVVATTLNDSDQPIVDFCIRENLPYFLGPEDDVLARYHGAATEHGADTIVRVTSDCPLIEPSVIDLTIRTFLDGNGAIDYVSNTVERTYPRGLDCEVFSFSSLETAHRYAAEPPEREHVTPFIYRHSERFRLRSIRNPEDYSRYRWTVDTIEDFTLIERLLDALYPWNPEFTMEDCLRVLAINPEWQRLNSHVEQKAYGQ